MDASGRGSLSLMRGAWVDDVEVLAGLPGALCQVSSDWPEGSVADEHHPGVITPDM